MAGPAVTGPATTDPAMTGPAAAGVSAVLPCFEEAGHLPAVVATLAQALDGVAPGRWEILLVTSARAADGTPHVATHLATRRAGVRTVSQPTDDPGYGRAVARGIGAARYPWLLLTDADGQFDHTELPRFVAAARNAELVLGYRSPRAEGRARRWAGRLTTFVAALVAGVGPVRDLDCAFKFVHAGWLEHPDWLDAAALRCRTGVVNAEILSAARRVSARVREVPVRHLPRRGGTARFALRGGPLGELPRPGEALAIGLELARLGAGRVRRWLPLR